MSGASNNVVANVPGDLNAQQQQIIVNAIQQTFTNGGHFVLQPDGSPGSQAMADSILQQAGQSGNGVTVSPAPTSWTDTASSAFQQGYNTVMHPGQAAATTKAAASSFIQAHAANWGLVILGVVLGVGALLISQKETIVQIGKTTAKAAALVGE